MNKDNTQTPSFLAPYDIGVVVNYYWKPSYPKSLQINTWAALSALLETGIIQDVLLVDGSPQHDDFIKSKCEKMGINYISSDKNLSYAEGFNLGISQMNHEYICLMANDVFPTRDLFEKLYNWVSLPDVGCVFPYLSSSDYPGQIPGFVRKPITCEPTFMTLNINIFRRKVLEQIGGIDLHFSGGFNDIVALIKTRELGYRVILVGDTNVTHLGRMTISQGSNYTIGKTDLNRFVERYPHFQAKHGKWGYKHWVKPFAVNKRISFLWWICQNFPSTRIRKVLERMLIRNESRFTRC